MPLMKRGANVALTREIPNLTRVVIGVRWNAGSEVSLDHSLVMATMLCGADGKALSDEHFVFFNQLTSPDESVTQLEQALDGDKEQIVIDLPGVPAEVHRIVVAIYVNDGPGTQRSLSRLRSCEVRVLNGADNAELIRSEELAAGFSDENALTLGELYRHSGEWKFKVLGLGYANGVTAMTADYGLVL